FCLINYAPIPSVLLPSTSPHDLATPSSPTILSSLFYRTPEGRLPKPSFTSSNVYSFDVLLLELLTGKTLFQDLMEEHGADIPKWVCSMREEEQNNSNEGLVSSGNKASEEKLTTLLNIAYVVAEEENGLLMREVLWMIKEVGAKVMVSSKSSDHLLGRC
ncbi:hypothetical protein BHE74_00048117, partial [Ensete ventricosum]